MNCRLDGHQSYLSSRRFDALDGLRAISVIAVIWHHTAPFWAPQAYVGMGAQGVNLFFAISGFLITTLLLRERDRNGALDLKAFYWRRALRIFPLYYAVLLLYLIVVALFEPDPAARDGFFGNLVYFATYTSNLFVPNDGRVIFFFAWSLAAEEQFYLIWPSLLDLVGSAQRATVSLSIVLAACIVDQLVGSDFLAKIPTAIVGGALLATALHSRSGFRVVDFLFGRSWSQSAVIVALGFALSLPTPRGPNALVPLLLVCLVATCVVRKRHWLSPILSFKPIAYVGSISYGIYMLHMLCKNASARVLSKIGPFLGGFDLFILTLIGAVVAAGISFRYFESYFLGLKTRFER